MEKQQSSQKPIRRTDPKHWAIAMICCVFVLIFVSTHLPSLSEPECSDCHLRDWIVDEPPPESPVWGKEDGPLHRELGQTVMRADNIPEQTSSDLPLTALEELHHAVETMQTHYFELWLGTWPDAIDWTAAVMGTYVSATLYSLTRSLEYILTLGRSRMSSNPGDLSPEGQRVGNEINKYFSQAVSFYFGENAFAIRLQAYDDMLWVVLGWLESIRFIEHHGSAHYQDPNGGNSGGDWGAPPGEDDKCGDGGWYGSQFKCAFAHRARIFYELASRGWDTKLCGGGMTWNPHLTPYKNAITNQLYIAASINMYLYWPGDSNHSPFMAQSTTTDDFDDVAPTSFIRHDPQFLSNAVQGYAWLKHSNMTNDLGLYTDGFHIYGWSRNSTGSGHCDIRNEMVYTYNQGVLLSGLRGLWEGTGDTAYLEDGHELIANVIKATGWHALPDSLKTKEEGETKGTCAQPWRGLGRCGVLEELCDASGTCSQDGQTFKGIFFHHLTAFCEPLPHYPRLPRRTYGAGTELRSLHRNSCKEYAKWVAYNARKAMGTRREGMFGGWWGEEGGEQVGAGGVLVPDGGVDYRNNRTVVDEGDAWADLPSLVTKPVSGRRVREEEWDANDRGRGRTVETQGGGVAVVRAMWELVNMYRED
ncbi:hypothetical protein LTS18_004983 [Coniosporium uncinatum]|uniref:Uncharacterized protein n=1 Tax=Coniosporium uncinatum TaxID=93489 RepID=A0ACC3D586_9PEZI|nr:hypothetical protein LTS18_004983 [Coniosporium uncinatum]